MAEFCHVTCDWRGIRTVERRQNGSVAAYTRWGLRKLPSGRKDLSTNPGCQIERLEAAARQGPALRLFEHANSKWVICHRAPWHCRA